MRRYQIRYLTLALAALLFIQAGQIEQAGADEPVPQVDRLEPLDQLALPPRQALPPLACLNCRGPAAIAPCLNTHRGFLYYGSYALDDDPFNKYGDCPSGQCGYPGAALSLWWIGHRQSAGGLRHHPAGHAGGQAVGSRAALSNGRVR